MSIFLNILFLILGMGLLIKGADFFVEGASAVAKRFKIPSMLIGLTVVAIGTSLPELSVSLASAFKHSVDMSVGNVIGSNMMNMLLILGIVMLIKPVPIKRSTKRIDLPFMLGITLLLLLFSADVILNAANGNVISRTESLIFLLALVVYMTMTIMNAKKEHKLLFENPELEAKLAEEEKQEPVSEDDGTEENGKSKRKKKKKNKVKKELKVWQIVSFILFGLGAVVFGAECVSTTAQFLALKIGMSEALVGLTVVAVGTSLPELATSIAASIKGENEMALGNIIGSNIFNIALILGSVGLITQISVSATILWDLLILSGCTIAFTVLCVTCKEKSRRWIGGVLIAMCVAYLTFAIVRNYCF